MAGPENVQHVRLEDGSGYDANIDGATHVLATIGYEHHQVHEGDAFYAQHNASGVADGGYVGVLFTTANTTSWGHAIFGMNSSSKATFELYENPTVTSTGTTVTAYNRDRNDGSNAVVSVSHTPTVSNNGTLIRMRYIGTGGLANLAGAGDDRGQSEFILEQNEQYYVKGVSEAASNNICVYCTWYEHTNNN